jgi:hypothetical protein
MNFFIQRPIYTSIFHDLYHSSNCLPLHLWAAPSLCLIMYLCMLLLQHSSYVFILVGKHTNQLSILSAKPIQNSLLENVGNCVRTFLYFWLSGYFILILSILLSLRYICFAIIDYHTYLEKLCSIYSTFLCAYLSDCDFFI